jgi:hypothetical protein
MMEKIFRKITRSVGYPIDSSKSSPMVQEQVEQNSYRTERDQSLEVKIFVFSLFFYPLVRFRDMSKIFHSLWIKKTLSNLAS